MKTYQYYLDEVSKEAGYLSFSPSFMINSEIEKLAREAAHRYTKQCIKEHLSRAAENITAMSTKFLVESRELQEQPGSEYGKTLLEGQVIGSLSVGQAIFESVTNIDIQLP